MAVANFHYITRMSSGFKVYILEGQPHLRSEDRYRHITNDRARAPTVYPVKRKRSHERGLTLEERRERALSRSSGKAAQRAAPVPASGAFNRQQSPTSTWSPTPSPTSPLPTQVYYTPVMDEPLALIKKPRKDPASTEEKTKSSATTQIQLQATHSSGTSPIWSPRIQLHKHSSSKSVYRPKLVRAMQSSRIQNENMRPSVITCVSSSRSPSCRSEVHRGHSSVISKSNYDHVVEEHFQRSLGVNYQKARSQQLSISVSVDDHFAKALGDKWLQIKSKSSSCSSTPPSSPSVTHSPTYTHSPNQSHKESTSSSSPTSSHWPVN